MAQVTRSPSEGDPHNSGTSWSATCGRETEVNKPPHRGEWHQSITSITSGFESVDTSESAQHEHLQRGWPDGSLVYVIELGERIAAISFRLGGSVAWAERSVTYGSAAGGHSMCSCSFSHVVGAEHGGAALVVLLYVCGSV